MKKVLSLPHHVEEKQKRIPQREPDELEGGHHLPIRHRPLRGIVLLHLQPP